MNASIRSSRRSLPLRPAALLLGLAALLACPTPVLAQRDHGDKRDRDRDHRDRKSDTRYSVGVGVSSRGVEGFHVGVSRDYRRDYYHRSHYRPRYRPGYYVTVLPRYHRRLVVNSSFYFYADGTYYRPYDRGYVVVERPVYIQNAPAAEVNYAVTADGVDPNQEIGAPEPAPPPAEEPTYLSVWQGEQELRLIDGEFFKPSSQGLVWVPTPVGAVSDVLPAGAQVVWHDEIEYFRFDGVVFRKSPDGYKVVAAPWDQAKDAS